MLEVHVVPVTWQTHQRPLSTIRQAVFVDEQNIPTETEFDAEDQHATHLIALNSAGSALGCARLLESGLIGRVAVVKDERGKGLGKQLLQATVTAAEDRKLSRVFLHAQEEAETFYRKQGFINTGTRFTEAGIAHVTMEQALPIPFETGDLKKGVIIKKTTPAEKNDNATGTDSTPARASELREFAGDTAAIEQLDRVLSVARRSLRIYSPTLDHALFDRATVVELVSNFARSAPGVQVEILIDDSSLIVSRGHLLVELRRRLDEKMRIRTLPDTVKADAQSWLVVDDCALWVQSEPNEYRGWSDTFNQVQAGRFIKRYTHLWDRSITDPELRLLQI